VSKRIYKIDLQRVCGLPGYRISDIDLASGRPVHAGYYCDKCEKEHQINRYLKQKAFDKGLKLTIYGRGNQRNL
jgi:hypothetical protein